jgi:hypothetical protein
MNSLEEAAITRYKSEHPTENKVVATQSPSWPVVFVVELVPDDKPPGSKIVGQDTYSENQLKGR